MDEKALEKIIEKYSSDFNMLIGDNSFVINNIKIFQTDNPIT